MPRAVKKKKHPKKKRREANLLSKIPQAIFVKLAEDIAKQILYQASLNLEEARVSQQQTIAAAFNSMVAAAHRGVAELEITARRLVPREENQ